MTTNQDTATAEPATLPADTAPSENPDFKGITAHELARALLKPKRMRAQPSTAESTTKD